MRIRLIFKPRERPCPKHRRPVRAECATISRFSSRKHFDAILARFERFYRRSPILPCRSGNVVRGKLGRVTPSGLARSGRCAGAEGVPLGPRARCRILKLVRQFIDWWIDRAKSAYGDFGGGFPTTAT